MFSEDGTIDLNELVKFTRTQFSGTLSRVKSLEPGFTRSNRSLEVVSEAVKQYCKTLGLRQKWHVLAPISLRLAVVDEISREW